MKARLAVALAGIVVLVAGCAAVPSEPPRTGSSATPVARAAGRPPTGHGPERIHMPVPARPEQPAIDARYVAGLAADHCVDRDVVTPSMADPVSAVLDRTYSLPAEYAPGDLVPAAEAGLTGASGTKLVRALVVEDLAAMRAAWEAAGLVVIVDSAYRSYASQASTFGDWVARLGEAEATVRSARPGHSEHQLGTTLDLSSPGWSGRFGDWAAESDEGAWLAEHAWEYGFVMSYPRDAREATCFSYEPWHYRWIGREAAAEHRASGLPLRIFLERRLDA
jgi:D-alanyl-D-alanine carboxypeptidase